MFLDINTVAFVFSLNSFISFFFKKSSVFLTTSQFCFKTITIVKKILCLLTLIICTAAKRKLVVAITRGLLRVGTVEAHIKENINLLIFFVKKMFLVILCVGLNTILYDKTILQSSRRGFKVKIFLVVFSPPKG